MKSNKKLILALMAAGSCFSAFAWNPVDVDTLEKTGSCTTGCDFTKAQLAKIFQKLREEGFEVNVSGANCTEANLVDADLTGAILNGADFTSAHLEGATLTNAYAVNTIFNNAHLEGATLKKVYAPFASFVGTKFNEKAKINSCNFMWTDFRDSNVQVAKMDTEIAFFAAAIKHFIDDSTQRIY